jgi:hypothetical protein
MPSFNDDWRLLQEFNSLSPDEQASSLPFCIAQNVTLEQFHTKCDQNESGGGSRWEFKDGEVWIYELTCAAHDYAAGEVIKRLLSGMASMMMMLSLLLLPLVTTMPDTGHTNRMAH